MFTETVADNPVHAREFAAWFQTGAGKALFEGESYWVNRELKSFYGYHMLEFALAPNLSLANIDAMSHPLRVLDEFSPQTSGTYLIARPEQIPVSTESIDLVVLHHTLDLCTDPHQALKEVLRVLRPCGHVCIVGFNPISLWGLWRLIKQRREVPWSARFLSPLRVLDWVKLLDMKVLKLAQPHYLLPSGNPLVRGLLAPIEKLSQRYNLPFGASYLIVAQKQVYGMTPLAESRWRLRRIVGLPVASRVTESTISQQNQATGA